MSNLNNPTQSNNGLEFLDSRLQQAIFGAASQNKTLFCFVADKTNNSTLWEEAVRDEAIRSNLISKAVTVRIEAGTQEAAYLNSVSPLKSIPAIVIIQGGQIVHNFQSSETTTEDLEGHLQSLYGEDEDVQIDSPVHGNNLSNVISSEDGLLQDTASQPSQHTYLVLPSSDGRMRLPNNAYDAFGVQTQKWVAQGIRDDNILRLQLKMLSNVPELHDAIEAIKSRKTGEVLALPKAAQEKLLVTRAGVLHVDSTASPAVDSTSRAVTASSSASTIPQAPITSTPTQTSNTAPSDETPTSESLGIQSSSQQAQQAQRTQYLRLQRERENAQKAERERIKAQIKTDREERRRLDELRKQSELNQLRKDNSTTTQPASTDIRLQVRAFDGSRMTSSFPHTSTIANDVRPWVDQTSRQSTPYNLKLILTPMPNRNIEAGEEEQTLSDLGIVGSATMVMVPVKTYVESYTGGGSGVLSTVTGVAGSVIGGIGSLFGFGGSTPTPSQQGPVDSVQSSNASGPSTVKVRTLADQRADEEASRRGNELYNGNQLNFQGKKNDNDDDMKKE